MFFGKTTLILKDILPHFIYFYIDKYEKNICNRCIYRYNITRYLHLMTDIFSNSNRCILHQFWLHKEQRGAYGL